MIIFCQKMSEAFALQNLLTTVQQKLITAIEFVSSVRLENSSTNKFIKLTTLSTTGAQVYSNLLLMKHDQIQLKITISGKFHENPLKPEGAVATRFV